MKQQSEFGVAGMAVMGQNLALNLASHAFRVSVWNRTAEKTVEFLARNSGAGIRGCRSVEEFVLSLERPRKILMMVQAGNAVDSCIAEFLPYLEEGDILMDGGNSFYEDTLRRGQNLAERKIRYLGVGISGGEEGALHGPSIMPGGDESAWPLVKPYLETVAAHVGDGSPCCGWIGPGGAGHFAKMVHNGIEYADMLLISETYAFLRDGLRLSGREIGAIYERWSKGVLAGYLLEITAAIFRREDPEGEGLLIDRILDAPAQKGTGRWTGIAALRHGVPAPALTDAVFQRNLGADVELRRQGEILLPGPEEGLTASETAVADLESALYAGKICAYAQGFALLASAEQESGWRIDLGNLALLWRGGCIIRAAFLDDIKAAYSQNPALKNLMLDPFFADALAGRLPGLRRTVAASALAGIPMPGLAGALGYFDSCRTGRSAGNLIQAQRDCFGAHGYERVDRPRGEMFHTQW